MVSPCRLDQQASPTPPGATPAFLHHVHVHVLLVTANFLTLPDGTVPPSTDANLSHEVKSVNPLFRIRADFFVTPYQSAAGVYKFKNSRP
jgi:hypothetical protein